jgi:hypothetical protein
MQKENDAAFPAITTTKNKSQLRTNYDYESWNHMIIAIISKAYF